MAKFIQSLVSQKFSIFNVSEKKAPVNKSGFGMSKWQDLTFEELTNEHNYNSSLWGMKMGIHENGRRILSLDFDMCGKKNETGQRIGCEYTKKKYQIYLNGIDNENGLFDSSTRGNANVLVDYTDCSTLIQLVEELHQDKFKLEDFEILLGGNQVIPPSSTICKITNIKGNPRQFHNPAKPFYKIENESTDFVAGFIQSLFEDFNNKKVKKPNVIVCSTPISVLINSVPINSVPINSDPINPVINTTVLC